MLTDPAPHRMRASPVTSITSCRLLFIWVHRLTTMLLLASTTAFAQGDVNDEGTCSRTFDNIECLRSRADTTNQRQQAAAFVDIAEVIKDYLEFGSGAQLSTDEREALMAEALSALAVAAELAVTDRGFWRLSHDIAGLAYALGDKGTLDNIFQVCIERCIDVGDKYIALIDYADTLAKFGAPKADTYFRQAIAATPDNRDPFEAHMRYAHYLNAAGRYEDALEILDGLDAAVRQMHPEAARMRYRLRQLLGSDAVEAGEEADAAEARLDNGVGVRRRVP